MEKTNMMSLIVLICSLSLKSYAFRLEPMVVDFTPEGEGSSKIFRVENEAKEKIAVKMHAFVRQIDDKGKETQVESKDFKIYPEQMTLEPSDSRAVRVTYLGPKDLEKESSYRIVATQLPVAFQEEDKKTGIKFLFQFVASAYVTNDKYYPKVLVESITRNKDNLKIKIINKGQKHVILKNVSIELKNNEGKIVKLDDSFIKGWDGENLLSGTRRTFIVKTPFDFDIVKNPPKISIKDEM
ncbi:MAG: fimbrial biogenesis chaperone [Pseudobdellovibrio sp.]